MSQKKIQKYNKVLKSLESITDNLGMPIDKRIRKTVVLFNLLGFPTSGSCGGHIEEDHGTLQPWVDIDPPKGTGLKRKAKKLITKFNTYREKQIGYQPEGFQPYIFSFRNERYQFRIQIGQDLIEEVKKEKKHLSRKSREWLHDRYNKEMKAFTNFLWDIYIN